MQLVSLDVGGAPKAWSEHAGFARGAFKRNQHAAFKQALKRHGYRTYYTPNKPTLDGCGHLTPRHGEFLAVSTPSLRNPSGPDP